MISYEKEKLTYLSKLVNVKIEQTGILTSTNPPRYSHHAPAASTTPSACKVFSSLSDLPPGSSLSFNVWYLTNHLFSPKTKRFEIKKSSYFITI